MLDEKTAKELAELVKAFVLEAIKPHAEEVAKLRDQKRLDDDEIETLKGIIANPPKDGEDGKSVTIEEVSTIIIEALPPLVEGMESKALETIAKSVNEAVEKINIPQPRDGEDGRDALDIEILPAIDEAKSYPRGTYAMHKGGLWRTHAKSEGLRGWECLVEGIAEITMSYDGERQCDIAIAKSGGDVVLQVMPLPMIIDRGLWNGGEYKRFDAVTWNGALWIAQEDNTDAQPGTEKAWRLAVKKGRDSRAPVKVGAA